MGLNCAESMANLHHPCHPPVTEVTQSTYNQNGEFEAAHCHTANYQLYIYLTLITSAFSYFCSEETSKGCAVRHSPYIVVTPVTNIQKGEFEAAHCRTEKPLVP